MQDWVRDCDGKPVWMNCPYNISVLAQWVTYAHQQSQRGCTVICLLPYWRNYPWFQIVKDYAEIRLPGAKLVLDGFGPKAGNAAAICRRENTKALSQSSVKTKRDFARIGWIHRQ